MVEWAIATVLKTVVLKGTVGSNPTLSAITMNTTRIEYLVGFEGFGANFWAEYESLSLEDAQEKLALKKQNKPERDWVLVKKTVSLELLN